MTAVAVVLACAALAFAYAAWERAGVTARAMYDHGQALQDARAELVNQKDTRAGPASECTCNRPE